MLTTNFLHCSFYSYSIFSLPSYLILLSFTPTDNLSHCHSLLSLNMPFLTQHQLGPHLQLFILTCVCVRVCVTAALSDIWPPPHSLKGQRQTPDLCALPPNSLLLHCLPLGNGDYFSYCLRAPWFIHLHTLREHCMEIKTWDWGYRKLRNFLLWLIFLPVDFFCKDDWFAFLTLKQWIFL